MRDAAPNLAVDLSGVVLRNPVMLAAGTAGMLDEFADVCSLDRVGAVVTKSITPLPRDGNAPWRVVPVGTGMLNAVGLANPGIDEFISTYVPRIPAMQTAVIASIAGFCVDDYVRVAAAINATKAFAAVELNVSCPNVHKGCEFAADPEMLSELIGAVRGVLTHTRLFVKLSPIPTGKITMSDIAKAAIEPAGSSPRGPAHRPGADALCIANTTPAMAIDVTTRKPRLGRGTGGLSGPAVHPMVVKLVYDVYRTIAKDTNTPLIGVGGVVRWEDAAEFILAGASAVQIGTGLFVDPRSPQRIVKGLSAWCERQGAKEISQLVGAVDMTGVLPR